MGALVALSLAAFTALVGPAEARAGAAGPGALRLRAEGIDRGVLVDEVALRLPELAVVGVDGPCEVGCVDVVVRRGVDGGYLVDARLADGRAYVRSLRGGGPEPERRVATSLAHLLAAIADGRAAPTGEAGELPLEPWGSGEGGAQESLRSNGSGSEDPPISLNSNEISDTGSGSASSSDRGDAESGEDGAAATKSGAGATKSGADATNSGAGAAEGARAPAVDGAGSMRSGDDPGRRSSAASSTPRLELGPALGLVTVFGVGPPRDLVGRVGGGFAVDLELRLRRGLLLGARVRAVDARDGGFRLSRARLALAVGYGLRRGLFELRTLAALTVEPWWVRARADGARASTGAPLIGGALVIAPGIQAALADGVRIHAGLRFEAAASAPPGAAGAIEAASPDGLARFRLGGFELSGGVEIGARWGLSRSVPRDRSLNKRRRGAGRTPG